MNFLDSTFDMLLKAFKVRTKELTRDQAQKLATNLPLWFAVELTYKDQPIRLVIAASALPGEFTNKLTNGAAHQDGPSPGVLAP